MKEVHTSKKLAISVLFEIEVPEDESVEFHRDWLKSDPVGWLLARERLRERFPTEVAIVS